MTTLPPGLQPIVPDDEMDLLEQIVTWQRALQTHLYGMDPAMLPLTERIHFLWTMHTAAIAEQQEMMDEVGWKPWASAKFINVEKAKGEVIDVLHFVISEAIGLGMTSGEIFEKYAEKQERNRARQRDGYTGVTEKCIVCHRDVVDVQVATGLHPVGVMTTTDQWYCGECGRGLRK